MGLPSQGSLAQPGSSTFRSGDVLDGRYRIERVIAEGGVAIVVAAEQLGLDRHVAIKLLRPETLFDRSLVEHFKTEGSLAAKIKSEHCVRIHDVGEGVGIGPYMVMELLEGHDLEQRLARGPIPMDEAVDYVLQACDALVEAHHLRIVHRDIKPANLYVASRPPRQPIVKIIDFGISKVVPRTIDANALELTAGTPAYMSPEQIMHGGIVDGRADIWSLGIVLHELMTGELPFPLDTPERMLEAICKKSPIPLRQVRPDLPEALERIILKCLAREPANRYAHVGDLANDLQPFARVRDVLKSSGEIETAHAYTDPRRQAPTVVVAPKKSRTALYVGVGLAVLATTGAGLIVAARRHKPAIETTAASEPPPAASNAVATATVATGTNEAPAEPSPPVTEPAPTAAVASATQGRVKRPLRPKTSSPAAKPTATSSNDRSTMFGERK